MTQFVKYANKYQTIKMKREDGIRELQFHTSDGPLRRGLLPHGELERAFLEIGRDSENEIVILTGSGNEFGGTGGRCG